MAAMIMAFVLGLSVFIIIYLLITGYRGQSTAQRELAEQDPSMRVQLDAVKGSAITSFALRTANRFIPKDRRTKTEALLQVAGLAFRPAEWLVFRTSVATTLGVVFLILSSPLVAVFIAVLSWFGLAVFVRLKAARRRQQFAEDLPDTLQLVAGSLRSGFSLAASLDAASQHAREPMASELKRALAKVRLGADLEEGLVVLAERMQSQDFGWVAMVVQIQREVGGNLADILETTVGTVRERFYLKRLIKSLSAEGRMSAYILVALPILVGLWSSWRNPDYASLLWTTTAGIVMLIGAAISMVVGIFWMRAVIRVEA